MGFAAGNERLIHALGRIKSYLDYGAFTPIQVAAAAALNGPQDCVDEMRAIYKGTARRVGRQLCDAPVGRFPRRAASMFAWAPIPEAFRPLGLARVFEAAAGAREGRGRAGHRASANTATAMCASRWSKTNSASGKRRATCASSWRWARDRRGAGQPRRRAMTAFARRHCWARHRRWRRRASIIVEQGERLAPRAAGGTLELAAVSARDERKASRRSARARPNGSTIR